jgi:hypothetical protein
MAPIVRPNASLTPHLRTVLTAHVPLKLVYRRGLGPPHHIERNGLMRVAAETPHFKVQLACVQRVTQCWRRLRWSLVA